MNRVLVVFSDDLLSELDSARGLVSRSAWIRQAVEDKLMKESVAPLVPQFSIEGEPLNEYELATDHATQFAGRGGREPKPKARRKRVKELESETLKAMESVEKIISPQRCNRGACTGTINPVKGRCVRCNQIPLKESK